MGVYIGGEGGGGGEGGVDELYTYTAKSYCAPQLSYL